MINAANNTDSRPQSASNSVQSKQSLWQHPQVDVFKHFKISPNADWRQNKKQGEVSEDFAKEIGRKVIVLSGSISANNFVQIPNPGSNLKTLGLTGRYLYLQIKSISANSPFSFHFDLNMAEKTHGIRISASNLYKTISTQNGFVVQVPVNLDLNRWTVVVFDIFELLKVSGLLPATYIIDGSYQIKSITMCASSAVRGIYTSDNLYDFVTLPSDMRFKFSFDIGKWPEYFAWLELPMTESQRPLQVKEPRPTDAKEKSDKKKKKIESDFQELMKPKAVKFVAEEKPFGNSAQDIMTVEEKLGLKEDVFGAKFESQSFEPEQEQVSVNMRRSPKLQQDPIMELKHIIGYSPSRCLSLKWTRIATENVLIYASSGTLIAFDVESDKQKKFFFGHSSPIVCFDACQSGSMLASAQEGKNSIIRIWDYQTARCLSMVTMPVTSIKCVSFSPDGRFLACVGKDTHNKELIVVWDISKIHKGDKPEIAAKQTSDFNILCLKFSPIDNYRLVSCGKENIRFWRIRETSNIRGSAVVLNHHARNTVFTCLDFEWGARASSTASCNPDAKENESLKRVYVASKHGMVFQINYHTEAVEATYRTNDSAIYTISVNEAFCVTGSDDQYLRVWPLDFSEFFMEAKHEGTVCQVDISLDGLRVVCGTLNGSIGVLDKSNQRYKTVVRSHTNSVVSMDFCIPKRNIITVSYDGTIRLWDIELFQQVVEFSSPIDQPLCVAAHPYLPIFTCGFASGTMRVFDIEKTCVADEFTQFNKAIKRLAYAPNGHLLVTCCEDGSIALHNATQQHLPTKLMHLQYAPLYVHVSFSPLLGRSQESEISLFGVMGEHGNNVMIYDCNSITLRHQIQAGGIVQSFEFSKSGRQIIIVLSDARVRFFSLSRFEGIFIRELSTVHRTAVNSTSLSLNGGYMVTGGEDTLVKVWDYEAQKNVPFFYESFIGHISPVGSVLFNPLDNNMVFSIGEQDGIYVWSFNGDVQSNYHPTVEDGEIKAKPSTNIEHQSILEQMRQQIKGKLPKKLEEGSFQLQPFESLENLDLAATPAGKPTDSSLQQLYEERALNKELTYNHFVSVSDSAPFDVEIEKKALIETYIGSQIVNGYEGFGGVHANLIWNVEKGHMLYTLNNKLIKEDTKTRQQTVFAESTVRLSCLAQSESGRFVAAAEGETNSSGNSYIFLFDLQEMKLVNRLTFHQKGVQALAFAGQDKLISIGVAGENALALWDIHQGLVLKSVLLQGHSTNQIIMDANEKQIIQFATIGTKGSFTYWRVNPDSGDLQFSEIDLPHELRDSDFVSACFTMHMPAPISACVLLLGTRDGAIVAYNPLSYEFLNFGQKLFVMEGQIGCIQVRNSSVLLASSSGAILRYQVVAGNIFPTKDTKPVSLQADGAVTCIQMDNLNNEGILGTSKGNLYYLNINERALIRIVSRAAPAPERISSVEFDTFNQNIFYSTSGETNGDVKLYTSATIDQVMVFQESNYGSVAFVVSGRGRKQRLIGYKKGVLKVVSLDSLKVDALLKINLNKDETLTVATFSKNGMNFAIGTSSGSVYLGTIKLETKLQVRVSKLDQLTTKIQAVTSIQLSNFDPVGNLLVAFDDGTVRAWQSNMSSEQFDKLMEAQKFRKGSKKAAYDVSELGSVQFDMIDHFDMFRNPHGLETLTPEDSQQLQELYGGKKYKECEALFAPGSSSFETYFCYVSSLQYLFVRNFVSKQTVRRIALMHFPICLQLVDYNRVATELGLKQQAGGLQAVCAVGTREGRALVYRVDGQEAKLVTKTKSGVIYGQITCLAVVDKGTQMLVGSSSGELATFDLKLAF